LIRILLLRKLALKIKNFKKQKKTKNINNNNNNKKENIKNIKNIKLKYFCYERIYIKEKNNYLNNNIRLN